MAKDITEKGAGNYYGIGFTSASTFERLLEMSAQVSGIYYYDYVNGKYDFSGYKDIVELGKRFISEDIAYPDQQGVDNMRAAVCRRPVCPVEQRFSGSQRIYQSDSDYRV